MTHRIAQQWKTFFYNTPILDREPLPIVSKYSLVCLMLTNLTGVLWDYIQQMCISLFQRKTHHPAILCHEIWMMDLRCILISYNSNFCLCSAYTFLKFVIMWTVVLLADFILEFRLEYLWPCWLFFGSVYTTFHCHGLVRGPPFQFDVLHTLTVERLHLLPNWLLLDILTYSNHCFPCSVFLWMQVSIQCIILKSMYSFVCRLFVLCLFALHSLWTSFAWFSFHCTGYSLWLAPMSYSITYGTPVSIFGYVTLENAWFVL